MAPTDRPATSHPEFVIFRKGYQVHRVKYHAGETLLQTARRGSIGLPSSCEQGACGTCMVSLVRGAVQMRANDVLTSQDIEAGYVLGCQSVPTTSDIEVELL